MDDLKDVILCWKNRYTKEDDFKIIPRDLNNIEKFREESKAYQSTYGCCNSEYDNLSSFEKFIMFLEKFIEAKLNIDNDKLEKSKYIIKYNDLKDFLYELGKIKEFKEIRQLRYQLFTDDDFEIFKEYEKETWR